MITVTVTATDIAKGKRYNAKKYPVALALRRATGREITVGPLELADENERVVELPKTVVNFIRRFDNGDPVKPFSFKIYL